MTTEGDRQRHDLRKRAEAEIEKRQLTAGERSRSEASVSVHELQTHQIELEMQNEELRSAQRDLVDSRDRYAELYDHAPVGYATLSADGLILDSNLTFSRLVGEDSTRGQTFRNFVVDADRNQFDRERRSNRALVSVPHAYTLRLRKAAGDVFWARLESTTPGDAVGRGVCRLAISDVTAARDLQDQLVHAQKMESLGQLAGGVAHDINNMLAAVIGNVSLLLEQIDDEHPWRPELRDVLDASHRGHELTRNLLGFAHKGKYAPQRVSASSILALTYGLLKGTLSANVEVRRESPSGLLYVHADAGQMSHVILNLCLNAAAAMPEGGILALTCEAMTIPSGSEVHGLCAGAYVRIVVRDTGHGMDEETKQRAFEPFFTTKPRESGTGLGLSMAYGAVKNHCGCVWLDSEPGVGTTVTILLPAVAAPAIALAVGDARPVGRRGRTVLIIDDEPMLRSAGERRVRRLGYDVLLADGGETGVALYKAHMQEITCVILDLAMPGMDGTATFKKLREYDLDAPVVISSGYFEHTTVNGLLERGALGFLQKPYSLEELEAAIMDAAVRQSRG